VESDPLTQQEKSWLKKLEKLLLNPPTNRLGFYTIGDNHLSVYDLSRENEVLEYQDKNPNYDFCMAVNDLAADFGDIRSACAILSTAG
jgi:hypothetical protein